LKFTFVVVIVALLVITEAPQVFAASQISPSGASSAVQNAFVAVQTAGRDGGNITSLVTKLNSALALVQKASGENSSNPAQASADLQSALTIAQQVQSSAAAVAQQGMSARQFQFELSVVSAVVIVGVAVALYVYGDMIYRRLWLRMYRGEVVKKVG
jgi:hypothetical protein